MEKPRRNTPRRRLVFAVLLLGAMIAAVPLLLRFLADRPEPRIERTFTLTRSLRAVTTVVPSDPSWQRYVLGNVRNMTIDVVASSPVNVKVDIAKTERDTPELRAPTVWSEQNGEVVLRAVTQGHHSQLVPRTATVVSVMLADGQQEAQVTLRVLFTRHDD